MTAVIFDAFGTLLKIQGGRHLFRRLLKIGVDQGRMRALFWVSGMASWSATTSPASRHWG